MCLPHFYAMCGKERVSFWYLFFICLVIWEMHLCLNQRSLLFLPINLSHCSILFSSSQHDLTPAIPTVDHRLCTIVRCTSHSKNCSTADRATCEFRSCFSISAGVKGAVVTGQTTVAGRGKSPENHLQWKPRLATWLCVHARLYGLAMSPLQESLLLFREYLELSIQIMSAE